jgi:hypothetical protein
MNRSHAVAAKVRAASTIPCRPIVVPPAATACQECADVPGTQHAAMNPAVGTTHDTSATSVEPVPAPLTAASTRPTDSSGGTGCENVVWMRAANARSSALYAMSFNRARLACAAAESAVFGSISTIPPS